MISSGRTLKVDLFLQSAMDKMFVGAGFSGFDPKFCSTQGWRKSSYWKTGSLEDFRSWFQSEAAIQLGWTREIVDLELAYFEQTQGWLGGDGAGSEAESTDADKAESP